MLVLVVAAGCGKSDKADGGGGGDKGKRSASTPGSTDVAALFTGTTVTLPPEVAKAAFGGMKAAVFAELGADSTYVSSKSHDGVSYDLDFSKTDKLEKITVSTKADLEPILTKAWGPPVKTKKEAFWFAPEAGMRAWLPEHAKGKSVTFSRYEPLARFLGPKGWDLAFAAGKPLFGATLDELQAGWGATLCDFDREVPKMKEAFEKNAKDSLYRLQDVRRELKLCPSLNRTIEQYDPRADTIRIGLDGKVMAFQMSIPLGTSPELQKQVLADLDAKFGTPEKLEDGDKHELAYLDPASKTQALVAYGPDYVSLTVSRYLPVADLIGGADKPGFGIETKSMPVGTFDQVKAEDPDHFRPAGVLAALIYPPTEYSHFNTEIGLHAYDKAPRTYEYAVVVHFTDREAFGDKIFELLKAKFGEPKKDAKSTDKDQFFTFAKGGRKVAARRVSQQWQLNVSK